MRLTVIGKSPSWQDAGGACSGYLVEEGATRLLLDCGNGVFGKLRDRLDYLELDAVAVSHMHADHILDLVPFAYGLTHSPRQQPLPVHPYPANPEPARPRLLLPPGGAQTMREIVGAWGNEALIDNAFEVDEYEPGSDATVGPIRISFAPVPHFIPTHAITVQANGSRAVYGADGKPSDELVDAASGADLLLVEATVPRPERSGERGHLTPAEAGEHARRAGVGRLVLTHISDEMDLDWSRDQAAEAFGGPVEIAAPGVSFEL